MNVILVTVDALRADHLGVLGYKRVTDRRLDEISASSFLFSRAISQSPHTPGSFPSLFSSTYPLQFGGEGSVEERRLLAQILNESGYVTAGFHSNPYLSKGYGFDRGFGRFDDSIRWSNSKLAVFLRRAVNYFFNDRPYLTAEEITKKGISWLEENAGDDLFLWLHYMDPHGPYQPPESTDSSFLPREIDRGKAKNLWKRTVNDPDSVTEPELETLRDLYDEEIAYADKWIGRLWDYLVSEGLRDETLFIVTADHGEQFKEHGEFNHPRQLYDELIHVPLIIHVPGLAGGRMMEAQVRTIDIVPTIIDRLGLTGGSFEGKSLLDLMQGKNDGTNTDAISEATGEDEEEGTLKFSLRRPGWKYILSIPEDGEENREFYDLAEDPDEQTNLLTEGSTYDRRELLDMDSQLRSHIEENYGYSKADGDDFREEVRGEIDLESDDSDGGTEEVKSRLEDLGYLD